MRKNIGNALWFVGFIGFVGMFVPAEALALQVHGEPEGLYVHQMAHLFYVVALGYFFWDIRRTAFADRGWRFLQVFCVLMICWNLLAFIGHLAGVYLDPQSLLQTDCYIQTQLLSPFTFNKYLFFITKLDHLIYVPALLCLFLGLRSFHRSAVRALSGGDR
jgi:hypothetical protein